MVRRRRRGEPLEITDRCPGGGEAPTWGTQTTRLCTLTHVTVKTGADEPMEDHRMLKDDGARVVWRVQTMDVNYATPVSRFGLVVRR